MSSAMQVSKQKMAAIYHEITQKKSMLADIAEGDIGRAERQVMGVLTTVADNDKLMSCDPKSISRCAIQAALLDLDVGVGLGEAWLVPYKGVCTLQIGYRGWQKKAIEAGYRVHASAVHSKDFFEFSDMPAHVVHRRSLDADRGEFLGSYGVATQQGHVVAAVWVTAAEVAKASQDTPAWRDWATQMRRKLAIARVCKELSPKPGSGLANIIQTENALDRGSKNDPLLVRSIDDVQPVAHQALESGRHSFGFTAPEEPAEPEPARFGEDPEGSDAALTPAQIDEIDKSLPEHLR